MQQAFPKPSAVPRIFDRMARLPTAQAWVLVLFCTDAAAVVDLLTGPDLWFGPGYLLVMCVATWSLGWRAGQITGIACMVLTFALNGLSLYPYSAATAFAWNFGMRFIAVSVVIGIIAGMRRAFLREWWLARSDVLTGALNRQAFFELASLISTQGWRLLIYADLDGMKKVNDVHGHAAGDDCLRAYGAAVRKMVRRDDIFARVGGDEFVIFMSVKDQGAAKAVASRLHKAMNAIAVERGTLKCSIGGLVVPPGAASVDDLVRNADILMYEAKLRGACLQLGIASDVQPMAFGRARAKSRIACGWWLYGRRNTVDRRAGSTGYLSGPGVL